MKIVSILNSPLLPVTLALLPLCKKLMFVLNETNIYRVCCTPVDMRQGILRLSQLVRSYNFTPSMVQSTFSTTAPVTALNYYTGNVVVLSSITSRWHKAV